jgi:thiamine-phosphate pyrophosphorylase
MWSRGFAPMTPDSLQTGGRNGTRVTQVQTDCQLYAVVEPGEAALERLNAALTAAPIASVLIVPGPGVALEAPAAKALVVAAQRQGAAALLADAPGLARALGADGVHLSPAKDPMPAYANARAVLGRQAIVGADAGTSRHDAMALAEAGADYIAFGAPAQVRDVAGARDCRNELIAWWAEIFEAPCVAFDVETPAEAEALALAGADFVAARLPAAAPPAAASELAIAIVAALRAAAGAGR